MEKRVGAPQQQLIQVYDAVCFSSDIIKTAVRAVAVLSWRFISTITGRTSDYIIITESLLYSIYASRIIVMNNISNCFETSPRLPLNKRIENTITVIG